MNSWRFWNSSPLAPSSTFLADRILEYFPGMLTQQRRRHGLDGWRQAHLQRRFNIGDSARGRMRDPAEAMAVAYFRRVESFLYRAQIANRYVGLLHLRHPVLKPVGRKDTGDDGAQLFSVGSSVFPVREL